MRFLHALIRQTLYEGIPAIRQAACTGGSGTCSPRARTRTPTPSPTISGGGGRAHAERALAHASDPRQPLALIAGHRLLGELDTAAGDREAAARHLRDALALADACRSPHERALTLLAMADLQTANGEREEAARLLDEVRATCESLGDRLTFARVGALAEHSPPCRLPSPRRVPPGCRPVRRRYCGWSRRG